jgi:hypothetical protein
MALTELLTMLLEFVVANPKNVSLAALLLVVGHHVRKGAVLGMWLSYTGVFAMLLALAMLFGVINPNVGVLQGLLDLVLALAKGIL